MTVSSTGSRVEYLENGVGLDFAFPFRFRATSELVVTRSVNGGPFVPVSTSSIVGGGEAGGTVTLFSSVAGAKLRIERRTTRRQLTDYTPGDPFPAETHEAALDRLAMVDQEQDVAMEALSARAVLVPDGEQSQQLPAAASRAGAYLGFDALGRPIPLSGTGNDAALRADLADPTLGGLLVRYGATTVAEELAAIVGAKTPRMLTAAASLALAPCPTPIPPHAFLKGHLEGQLKIAIVGTSRTANSDITKPNGLGALYARMLRSYFPRAKVANFSIPGRSLQDLINPGYTAPGSFVFTAPGTNASPEAQFWPNGSTDGKSWLDHVKDWAPDAILLEQGPNDGDDNLPFSVRYYTLEALIGAWPKKPWLMLWAGALESKIEGPFAAEQVGRQSNYDFLRHLAVKRGYELVDENKWSRLLRDGLRTDELPRVPEKNFLGWGDAAKWQVTGAFTKTGDAIAGAGLAQRADMIARDGQVSGRWTPAVNNAAIRIDARGVSGLGSWFFQIDLFDNGDGSGKARLFWRDTDNSGSPDLIAVANCPIRTAGQPVPVLARFNGRHIELFLENRETPLISVYDERDMRAGTWAFGWAAGSGTIDQFEFDPAPATALTTPFYTEADLLGSTTVDPTYPNGNGKNHPTTLGAYAAAAPAIAEHLHRLKAALNRPVVLTSGPSTSDITATNSEVPIAGTGISFTLDQEQMVTVAVEFAYLNPNPLSGVVSLRLDGTGVQTWYLKPTGADTENRQIAVRSTQLIPAGTHTMDLSWGLKAGMTSNVAGGDNKRQLSLTVIPG
jgi:hypothetical protein